MLQNLPIFALTISTYHFKKEKSVISSLPPQKFARPALLIETKSASLLEICQFENIIWDAQMHTYRMIV